MEISLCSLALLVFAASNFSALKHQSSEAKKLEHHPEFLVGPQVPCASGDLKGAREMQCYQTPGAAERMSSPFRD